MERAGQRQEASAGSPAASGADPAEVAAPPETAGPGGSAEVAGPLADPGAAAPAGPRRVLVLSAPVGEGHVAAARVLAARARAVWPDAVVQEVERTGRGGALRDRALRASYALVMRVAPAAYGVGYDLLLRFPRFAELCKRVAAARLGRALAPLAESFRPDLVLSTYPMISGGLAWLRRRGRLPGRSVAVVTDAAVHPFWAWADVDETWTLFPASREQALQVVPGADVRVVPPAVDPRFRPADRGEARAGLGLPRTGFVVLATGGSLGFGGLARVVDAVLAADPLSGSADGSRTARGGPLTVVVLCGRNARLRAALERCRDPRVRALGWTDRVPEYVAAADVVLTTAGGMIASEALAAGRPVLFAAPVPGHGRAGAELTAAEGLALVCRRPADVTATLQAVRADPALLTGLQERALRLGGRNPGSVRGNAAVPPGGGDLDAALRDLGGRAARQAAARGDGDESAG